ncbi:MAG: hypothetical protein KDA85_07145 [Planctomycetaceae bacterium]|nr:hypothetical protein [Planctomycetaceae bacterium]
MIRISVWLFSFCLLLSRFSAAQDDLWKHHAKAPPKHAIHRSEPGGAWFVPMELHERYQALKSQTASLAVEIEAGRVDGNAALQEIAHMEAELASLEREIAAVEVFVSPFKVFRQTDTYEFPLGEQRMVLIQADGIRVRSWDGNGIRCELQKTVLAETQPAAEVFEKIAVKHENRVAADLVGETDSERQAREDLFMQSSDGKAMTAEQRVNRDELLKEIADSWRTFTAFQGKSIDVLKVEGIAWQEGNEHISYRIDSEGGSGRAGSTWKNAAELTVYLPADIHATIQGCQTMVDVDGFRGSLILSHINSLDRDYHGSFTVRNVHGALLIDAAPIRLISNVTGTVVVQSFSEARNGGTHHSDKGRRMYTDNSSQTVIENIKGDLTAEYLTGHLQLDAVTGTMNITNRHGTTELTLTETPAAGPHRLASESGRISISGDKATLHKVRWYLASQCGELETNLPDSVVKNVMFTSGEPWHGLFPASGEDDSPLGIFQEINRFKAALNNGERTPGFDVISRAGRISLQSTD